jgi:hypothetical protein
MEAVRKLYLRTWRGLILGLSLVFVAYLLYFRRLGNLLPGYSGAELNTYQGASDWHNIVHDPVNAPYKALVWLVGIIAHHGIFGTRIVSAVIGLLAAVLFFVIVRAWCTYRVAFVATIMFATSSGLLHFARLGTGDILQMSVLALLSFILGYRAQHGYQRLVIGYLLVALFVLAWYIPGMIWFELLGLIPLRTTIVGQLRRAKTINLAGFVLVFLAFLAPLVAASVKRPKILLEVLGLPQSLHTLTHFLGNLWNIVLAITVHSNGNPLFWVGHAPLLNTVEVIVGLLGAYYIYREASKRRTFMFGSLAIGLVLVSLGGAVTFACLVPIMYLLMAIGLDRFLGSWQTVFPRNPIARMAGVGILFIMLAFSVLYQIRAYYVAWPNAPATRQVFDHRES